VHPAIRIGPPSDRVKLPCFWLSNRQLVLPAIGEFTGTHTIRMRDHDRVWMIADDDLIERTSTRSGPPAS
jgi:metallophosphoesterase superfamily enzyme